MAPEKPLPDYDLGDWRGHYEDQDNQHRYEDSGEGEDAGLLPAGYSSSCTLSAATVSKPGCRGRRRRRSGELLYAHVDALASVVAHTPQCTVFGYG